MTTKIADDTASIAQRLKEIEAEKMAAIMGKPLEDPQPTEAPADIDWTGMYGYPCGYKPHSAHEWTAHFEKQYELKSLAHPEYPYTGTPHEWRVRIK